MVRLWKQIPKSIQHEINYINDFTARTNREASVTACARKGEKGIYVSNHFKGDNESTEALDCDENLGTSTRLADVHTHPRDKETIGVLPSTHDLYGTLVDSYNHGHPQFSCVTSPKAPLYECYIPKQVPSYQKLKTYEKHLPAAQVGEPGFYMDNVPQDFDFGFYRPDNGRLVPNPKPDLVVDSVFGGATENLRSNLNDLEHAGFCQYVKSFTKPNDERIVGSCIRKLRTKQIFGIEYKNPLER